MRVKTFHGKGRGLVAEQEYARGSEVMRCPVVCLPANQLEDLFKTDLANYAFQWNEPGDERSCITLGLGSLVNHSRSPNLDYSPDFDDKEMVFTALRDIAPGEELTIDYGWMPTEMTEQAGRRDHGASVAIPARYAVQKGMRAEMWWNGDTKDWVLQWMDANSNQVGEATYCGPSKARAMMLLKRGPTPGHEEELRKNEWMKAVSGTGMQRLKPLTPGTPEKHRHENLMKAVAPPGSKRK